MVDTVQTLPATERGKLPIGGVIAGTFRVFGKAPFVFLLFGLVSQIPTAVRLLVGAAPQPGGFSIPGLGFLLVSLLVAFLIQTSMTYLAARLSDDQPAPLGEALKLGVRRYLPMLGTTILVLLAFYGGLVLLVVPGIIFIAMFAIAVPVCAVEGLGPIASMKRSAALTKYTRWRILGIYLIFFLPLVIVALAIAFALILNGHLLLGQWLNAALQLVWVPIATIFSTMIYIELRRLKENFGVARIFD